MKASFRTASERLGNVFGRGRGYLFGQRTNCQKEKEPKQALTAPELVERLTLASPDLVEELYKLSKEHLANEAARENNLNGKATSLLTASGLSLTVAFTFGGLLLQHPEYLAPLDWPWPYIVPILYGCALLMGFISSAIAVWSLFVRDDYKGLSEGDVFNPGVLAYSDALDFASLSTPAASEDAPHNQTEVQEGRDVGGDQLGEDTSSLPPQDLATTATVQDAAAESADNQYSLVQKPPYPKSGTAHYRRFITGHFWQIAQEHFRIHEIKAKRIKLGQVWFLGFLLVLGVIGSILACVAFRQQDSRIKSREVTTSTSTGTSQAGTAQYPLANSSIQPLNPTVTVSPSGVLNAGTLPGATNACTTPQRSDAGIFP